MPKSCKQSPAAVLDKSIKPLTSLNLFKQGFKLDISAFSEITNQSIHIAEKQAKFKSRLQI